MSTDTPEPPHPSAAFLADKGPGSEYHLTLLMAPHQLHAVVGQDRQHLLAFARDVWAAALAAPAAAEQPVAWIRHEWSGTGRRELSFEGPPTPRPVRDEVVNPIWTPLYAAAELERLRAEAAANFLRAREWAERCGAAQAEVEALRAERQPLTAEQVRGLMREAGYSDAPAQSKADFINGLRHGERAHGIAMKEQP